MVKASVYINHIFNISFFTKCRISNKVVSFLTIDIILLVLVEYSIILLFVITIRIFLNYIFCYVLFFAIT